jgi:hypothetical protein
LVLALAGVGRTVSCSPPRLIVTFEFCADADALASASYYSSL